MADQQPPQAHQAAGKLAQLLGEVIVHHAPWTAQISEEEKWRQTEQFLEGLEAHTAEKIGPVLVELFDGVDIPESLQPIVKDAIGPQAQFSAIVTQLFLYGIVSQLLSTSVQPYLQGVSNDLWTKAVSSGISVPVSPAVIATAAARGLELGADPTVTMPGWAYVQAAMSGVSKEDIDLQASIVGTPPAPQELFELYRRGKATIDQIKQGLREGDTRDDWIDQLTNLTHTWATPLDFVRAAVQEQMTYGDAAEWANKTGLDTETSVPILTGSTAATPDMFGLLYSIAGRPPGPVQLGDMALRGIIPVEGTGADVVSFQQGIAESDVKTKWTEYLWELMQYVPAPGEIGTLLTHGAIDEQTAIGLWQKRGVPEAIAKAYAYEAEQQHITQDKLLAKGTILTAYYDQLLERQTALDYLDQLGYRGQIAQEMLLIQDFKREIHAIDTVAKHLLSLYGQFKLSATDTKAGLVNVGIPADQAQLLMGTYEQLRIAPIRLPSVREIGLASHAGTITTEEALDELGKLGYQPRDAAIVLSAYTKAKIDPLPAPGTTVTG